MGVIFPDPFEMFDFQFSLISKICMLFPSEISTIVVLDVNILPQCIAVEKD
jgi:hypothetical protein